MRTPEGHKIQKPAKCATAPEQADDNADVVLLGVYSSQALPSRAIRATEATGPQVPAG